MSDSTNLPIKQASDSDQSISVESLTDQQWLFIKYFLETSDLMKSYREAGYEGKLTSAPYQLFKKLKPLIEELVNNELIAKLKFNNDLKAALSIPLASKESLTVSEWLRIRKHAKSLIPELEQPKQQLSVLVVNRYTKDQKGTQQGQEVSNLPSSPDIKEVIDVEPTP